VTTGCPETDRGRPLQPELPRRCKQMRTADFGTCYELSKPVANDAEPGFRGARPAFDGRYWRRGSESDRSDLHSENRACGSRMASLPAALPSSRPEALSALFTPARWFVLKPLIGSLLLPSSIFASVKTLLARRFLSLRLSRARPGAAQANEQREVRDAAQ